MESKKAVTIDDVVNVRDAWERDVQDLKGVIAGLRERADRAEARLARIDALDEAELRSIFNRALVAVEMREMYEEDNKSLRRQIDRIIG